MIARLRSSDGFTLVELLVVILVIGILAAIALPTFVGQGDKAKDATAKSDVRNAVSAMESCAAARGGSYAGCTLDVLRREAPGLAWSADYGAGRISFVGDPTRGSYLLVAWSPSNMIYAIGRDRSDFGITGQGRRCVGANSFGGTAPESDGGCPGGRSGVVAW